MMDFGAWCFACGCVGFGIGAIVVNLFGRNRERDSYIDGYVRGAIRQAEKDGNSEEKETKK